QSPEADSAAGAAKDVGSNQSGDWSALDCITMSCCKSAPLLKVTINTVAESGGGIAGISVKQKTRDRSGSIGARRLTGRRVNPAGNHIHALHGLRGLSARIGKMHHSVDAHGIFGKEFLAGKA